MKQKIALTAAHFLASGTVADMGMGSGSGSYALAALYPSLSVVGVDVNPTMVEIASQQYQLPNLRFIAGDIARECFEPESLDGVFDSSVLHHVTTFSGYDYSAAARAVEVQARQLRSGGMLIIRDFVATSDEPVILEVSCDDGDASNDPQRCSTAALFRRFATEFRKLSPKPGFAFEELEAAEGRARFRVSRRIAAEFLLRKDYRRDWDSEVLEEYGYFTQGEFEELFERIGLRIVASMPLRNPWIVRNRWEGKVALTSIDGGPLELPPTNYLIAGEKVPRGAGVRFTCRASPAPTSFLTMRHYRDLRTGRLRDLVRRPNPTIDVVPWFESGADIYVLARKSYPRPILCTREDTATSLDGARTPQYITEPLNVIQRDEPFGATVEETLARRASIRPEQIRAFDHGCVYYPSPGGIEEEVRSALVEIEPAFVQQSGQVRAIEAMQLLRAAQVGGLPDARVEINVYELLRRQGRSVGPWIGAAISLTDRSDASPSSPRQLRPRRAFVRATESSGFLAVHRAAFDELDHDGNVIATKELEYVTPRTLSVNTIATALLRKRGVIEIGVDDDDLPAAQSFSGNSAILVAPAWRLPREITSRRAAVAWIRDRLAAEYGATTIEEWDLGGSYCPSPGVTPEVVHPIAFDVADGSLTWIPLLELIADPASLIDGHLRIVALRAAHALGLLL